MKVLVAFGTRPEAIKMVPVCFALKRAGINFKLCVTAQHREMLDQVLDFFDVKPDYDLDLMTANQTLNQLSSKLLYEVDKILSQENFDLVLVHGDTTTSSMTALAAFHRNIKVGHVEAGLRTYNKNAPFPEELNRQITGRISDFHFAPTQQAKENLLTEQVCEKSILVTGNTVVDAISIAKEKLEKGFSNGMIEKLKAQLDTNKKILLITGHRRESFGEGFQAICDALLQISERDDVVLVYPVHLNPNVRETVYNRLTGKENIHLIEPLDYPTFIWLMSQSFLIISDSGGIQEEAPTFKVPVLVTRNVTERQEGIAFGCSKLVGTDTLEIISSANEILNNTDQNTMSTNPYGDGHASHKIVEFLLKTYNHV